jgi:hypothetical protein
MKQQLRIGSNPITIQGQSFGRAYLLVQGVGAAAIVNTDFSLPNLRVQLEITQAGVKDSTAFNAVGPFTRLLLEKPFSNIAATPTQPDYNVATTGQSLGGCKVNTAGTQTVFAIPLLEGGYILKGDDFIRFNIDILPAFYSANVTAGSSVYLVTEEANGIVQADINMPVYEPITTDKQSPAFTYDSVSECAFLNAVEPNADGWNNATDPLQSVDFRSSYVNEQFDINTLYGVNLQKLANPLTNSHPIYYVEPSALWDCQIGLAINVTNVTIGSQFLYVRKVLTSATLVQRAQAQENKIVKSSLKNRGVYAR